MAKIDARHTFSIAEPPPRFTSRDFVVVAVVIGLAAALVAIPSIFDVRELAAALNIAEGWPLP